mgnify:CR=1 FL=1
MKMVEYKGKKIKKKGMGKITKNYLYNLIYQIFIMFVPLITAPYLARVLGPEGTGIYSYIYSVTTVICTFVMLGIYNYGNRQIAYVRDDEQKLSEVFWQIMSARIIIAFLGTIVYFGITMVLGKYRSLFCIYYIYLLAYFIDCTWLYIGVEDMKWAVIKNTVTKIFAVAGIFIFVKNEDDVWIYVLIQAVSVFLSNLLAYTQIKRYAKKPHFDFSNIKSDICGAAMLFLPSVATTIYTQCDKIMIELLTGQTDQVSFYDYSEKIVTIPLTFITVLSTVMMPRIANEFKKGNKDSISSLLNRAARFSMFLAFPMVLGLIAVADKLVPWYLGKDFAPTVYAIVLIAPMIISNTLSGISGNQYFTATNQISILIKSQFTAAIANVIINAILIPHYGFYGAALATLMTSFSCAIIQYIFMLKQIKLPGLFKETIKYLIISLVMLLGIRIITGNMKATPLTNIVQVVIGCVIYIIGCLIMKDEQIKFIINKLKSILYK